MATRALDRRQEADGDTLFARVGAFLADHRLSPDPAHYAFVYQIIADPCGALAKRVAELTDGGFRLAASDIVMLGGTVQSGPSCDATARGGAASRPAAEVEAEAEALIARALTQLHGVTDTIRAVHAETGDFGRDLRASADAISAAGDSSGIDEVTRLTAAMVERVQQAEHRLHAARHEADVLRQELDAARGIALTDPLTELPNRRAFDQALAAVPTGARHAVALCDIDHFKDVNDAFGHTVGDRVLRMVARTLAAELGGMVARWGGEEFAVLFDHADLDAAIARIDQARDALTAKRLRVRETGQAIGTITFSAGVAIANGIDGGQAALDRADRALYHAKDAGRARTIRAG